MMTIIPWASYTWKSHVKDLEQRLRRLKEEISETEDYLDVAKAELQNARGLGIENQPLPSDYGKRLVGIKSSYSNVCDENNGLQGWHLDKEYE